VATLTLIQIVNTKLSFIFCLMPHLQYHANIIAIPCCCFVRHIREIYNILISWITRSVK